MSCSLIIGSLVVLSMVSVVVLGLDSISTSEKTPKCFSSFSPCLMVGDSVSVVDC